MWTLNIFSWPYPSKYIIAIGYYYYLCVLGCDIFKILYHIKLPESFSFSTLGDT